MSSESQRGLTRSQYALRIVFTAVLLAALLLALWSVKDAGLLKRALDWIQELGPAAPLAFIAIYIGSALCLIPASFLTVGAGFVFGLTRGSIYVLTAATIAGNLTFLIARHLARGWIAHRLEGHPRFK